MANPHLGSDALQLLASLQKPILKVEISGEIYQSLEDYLKERMAEGDERAADLLLQLVDSAHFTFSDEELSD